MPTFLHAADVHLDSPLHGLVRYEGAPVHRLRVATREALARLVDVALDEQVAFVVLAGDVYDGALRDDAAAGLGLQAQLQRLREAKIPVVLAFGNHDATCSFVRHVRLPDNVHVLATQAPETRVYDHLGVAVHGQGYPRRHVHDDLSARYPDAVPGLLNVGVLHTALEGRPGHDPYAPCRVDGLLRRGYAYWALGHVHEREVVARDPWVVFPGNLQGRGFHEAGAKGCTLVTWEGDRVFEVEHRTCDVVRWAEVTVDATDAQRLDDVLDRARLALEAARDAASGRLLVVRVDVRGACRAHRALARDADLAEAELRALANELEDVWLADVRLRTRPEVDLAALRARDDAVAAIAAELHAAGDVTELLADLRAHADALLSVLPAELRGSVPTDPPALEALLVEAQARLLGRLVQAEEEEV